MYLRITAATESAASVVRAVEVDLQPAVSRWAGVANVLLHTGTPAPGGHTFSLAAYVVPASGESSAAFRGFISGWLESS